jgi:hypothetical protein
VCPNIASVWYWTATSWRALLEWTCRARPGPQYGGGEADRSRPITDRWGDDGECTGAKAYRLRRRNGTVYTQVTLGADGKLYDADGAQAIKGQ